MVVENPTSPPPWLRGAFHELNEQECHELLAQKKIGRVAFWGDDGPTVFPVNYVSDGDGVRFRTSPYARIAQQGSGSVVAFEVDETDDYTESGWSVLVRGPVEVVLGHVPGPEPEPWPEGVRSVLVRIRATSITGRRVLGH